MKNFSRKNKKIMFTFEWAVVPACPPGTEGTHDPIQKCARTTRDEKFFTQKQKNLAHLSVPSERQEIWRTLRCMGCIGRKRRG
jgi:hypothetical protein